MQVRAKTPEPITPERLAEILPRVRLGDTQAIHEMTLGHLRLATRMARRFSNSRNLTRLIDEMVQDAQVAVFNAITDISTGRMANHDNVGAYVVLAVKRCLYRSIGSLACVYFPRTALGDRRPVLELPESYEPKPRRTSEIWDQITSIAGSGNSETIRLLYNWLDGEVDSINVPKSDFKIAIVYLRRWGFTDAEIGSILGVSTPTINNLRRELHANYRRLEDELA